MTFPAALDTFADPRPPGVGQYVWLDGTIRDALVAPANILVASNPALVHSTLTYTQGVAIQNLEAKVGIDGSAVTSSLDYLVKNTSSVDPGHKHTLSSLSSLTGLSVLGRSASTSGVMAAITAILPGTLLRYDGTGLSFGPCDFDTPDAISGEVPVSNGGTAGTTATEAQVNLIAPLDRIAASSDKDIYFPVFYQSDNIAYRLETLEFINYILALVPSPSPTTPGGSNGDIQVNVSGAFGAVAGLSWSTVTQHLTVVSQGNAIVPIVAKAGGAGFTANYYEARTFGNVLDYAVRQGGGVYLLPRAALSTEGDLWNDSTQKTHATFLNGMRQDFDTALFTQTADKTVTNTAAGTQTTLFGTGTGSTTLATNFFVVGKTIRVKISGVYSTPIGAPSVTIRVKYGSTVLAVITSSALGSGSTNLRFEGEAIITCRTTGATGTVMTDGSIEYETVAGTTKKEALNNAGAGVAVATTINTTTSNAIDVTAEWDTNTTSRIVKSTIATVQVIK